MAKPSDTNDKNDLGKNLEKKLNAALNKTAAAKNASNKKSSSKNTSNKTATGKNTSTKTTTSKNTSNKNPSNKNPSNKSTKSKKNKNRWGIRLVAILIIGVILGVSLLFESNINAYLRLKGFIEEDYSGLSTEQAVGGEGVISLGNRLNIHFVDVGQGDACIIELPDERKMIIDGGKDKEKQKLLGYIEENIAPNENNTVKFDYAILTHSDEDHCGGLDDVFEKYSVGVFYRPNQLATYNNYNDPGKSSLKGDIMANAKNTLAYRRAIEAGYNAAEKKIVTDARDNSQNRIIPSGIAVSDDDYYEINFYTPTKDNYKNVNDYSPIIILQYRNKRIALSGDAEAEAEKEFVTLANGSQERFSIFTDTFCVDLIKVGHHGSRTSSSQDYLNTLTTPDNVQNVIIVISCGSGNSYGHPHVETVERLIAMGFKESNILRTDTNGNITMSIRQDDTGAYQLFHGAEMVRKTYNSPLSWREIAIIIFVIAALVILIEPLFRTTKRKSA